MKRQVPASSTRVGFLGVTLSTRSRTTNATALLLGAAIAAIAIAPLSPARAAQSQDSRPLVLTVDGITKSVSGPLPQRIGSTVRDPRTQYLQAELLPALPSSQVLITWFKWHGDADYTNQVVSGGGASSDAGASLEARIQQLIADRGTRPIAIVTHSWGGVLAYLALARLEQSQRIDPGAIDLLITIHTPLAMPAVRLGEFPVQTAKRAFVAGVVTRFVGPTVGPLASVKRWENYHSRSDWISWPIQVAQENSDTGRDHTTSHTDPAMQARYAKAILALGGAANQHPGATRPGAGPQQGSESPDDLRKAVGMWSWSVAGSTTAGDYWDVGSDGSFTAYSGATGRITAKDGKLRWSESSGRSGSLTIRGDGDSRQISGTVDGRLAENFQGGVLNAQNAEAVRKLWPARAGTQAKSPPNTGIEKAVGQWYFLSKPSLSSWLVDVRHDGSYTIVGQSRGSLIKGEGHITTRDGQLLWTDKTGHSGTFIVRGDAPYRSIEGNLAGTFPDSLGIPVDPKQWKIHMDAFTRDLEKAEAQAKVVAESQKRLAELQKRTGCAEWLDGELLSKFFANPFLSKGKTLCFQVSEVQVTSESAALMGLVLGQGLASRPVAIEVIGFPASRFQPTNGPFAFVGIAAGQGQRFPLFRYKALEARR